MLIFLWLVMTVVNVYNTVTDNIGGAAQLILWREANGAWHETWWAFYRQVPRPYTPHIDNPVVVTTNGWNLKE